MRLRARGQAAPLSFAANLDLSRTVSQPLLRPSARARLAAEGLLMLAPSCLVLRAFVATAYKREPG
jgi:hypothetical protein